jgi:hypothetical protein
MKDIVISGQRIVQESLIFVGCILAALVVNVYSIVRFKTEWKELITTLHITLVLALFFFVFIALLRGIVSCGRRVFRKKAG